MRIALPALVAPIAVVAGLALTGCGGQSQPGNGTAPIGTGQIRTGGPRVAGAGDEFAGVVWTGGVESIAAAWRVPSIQPGSEPGRAATWIGAQGIANLDPAPGTKASAPFIQIGTQEELHRISATDPRGQLFYEAFWTDVVRGLHPIPLFTVRPGDTVEVHMSLQAQRWTLTISDTGNGQTKRISTGQEGTGDFKLALWLQEDPTNALTNGVFAYPDISALRMSGLRVNATRPAAATLKTTWMALPHAYLGPTPPAGDAFSVVPRALSPAGARYLDIVDPADAQIDRFIAVSSTWRRGVSASVVRTATERLIAALATNDSRLLAQRWPADVAGLVGRLVSVYAAQVSALRRAVNQGSGALLSLLEGGMGDPVHETLATEIRAGLGLPLTAY